MSSNSTFRFLVFYTSRGGTEKSDSISRVRTERKGKPRYEKTAQNSFRFQNQPKSTRRLRRWKDQWDSWTMTIAYTAYSHKTLVLQKMTKEHRVWALNRSFLWRIPTIKDPFVLVYDPPHLHLKRPHRNKKTDTENRLKKTANNWIFHNDTERSEKKHLFARLFSFFRYLTPKNLL